MAHGFFGLMKPYGGRRSSATATGMRQNQAGKDMCQMCRRMNQRFLRGDVSHAQEIRDARPGIISDGPRKIAYDMGQPAKQKHSQDSELRKRSAPGPDVFSE